MPHLSLLIAWLTLVSAYVTHLMWSITFLLNDASLPIGKVVLAGIGILAPPIGIVHGVMIWVGTGAI